MKQDRFHGRVGSEGRCCDAPHCPEAGEFRAPGIRSASFDGPGEFRWYCLDHVRAFNSGYNWFAGMTPEEVMAAQHPVHGWDRQTRAFSPTAGIDQAPRWGDFADPLDAITARARARKPATRADGRMLMPDERRALDLLDLPLDADRRALRMRYADLVRALHPDRNGGDRSHEARLQQVIEAYQLLKNAVVFA